jgi:hypothetical protein
VSLSVHMMFKRIWFDEARCAPGLEALRQHRVDYDEKTRAFKKTQENWTSDAADAFRYVAMAWKNRSYSHMSGFVVAPGPSERCMITESVQWPNLKPIEGR